MKVGVTGGGGFIGLYVCEALTEHGHEVVVFDHHRRDDMVPLSFDYEVFMGDIRDATAVTEFVAHVDGVIHLAACLGTQETIMNPYPAAETNLLGGLNVLQAVAQYKVPMAYIAVGNWWMNNPYSITKNMIERFVQMYNKDRMTKINIVRAVNAYGPRQLAAAPFGPGKVRKITPAFICRALCDMPIEVYGYGENISDMVYVADVAEALVRALEHAADGDVFDKAVEIGPYISKTVNQVAEAVTGITGPVPIEHTDMRPGEIAGASVTADTTTLKLINMKPEDLTPLEVGLPLTVEYFRDTKGTAWHDPRSE